MMPPLRSSQPGGLATHVWYTPAGLAQLLRLDAEAADRLLARSDWTRTQREWLERIGKQMRLEVVVDKEALDHGQFRNQGGFNRMNRLFDGRLEDVLGELHEEVWRESA